MKAIITKDAQKLWSCPNFRKMFAHDPDKQGKLPKCSGEEVILAGPFFESPWCEAKAWNVDPEWLHNYQKRFSGIGYQLCEHQIDFIEDGHDAVQAAATGDN